MEAFPAAGQRPSTTASAIQDKLALREIKSTG
jgi:hypothetical protein